jgi:RNA polymerase sigma-70 factor (ECF subfamily)
LSKINKEQLFSELIETKLQMLRRVVFRIVKNEHAADDVIQDALVKAWNKFDACAEQSRLSSWVCRIACNQAYDLFRKQQHEARKLEQLESHDRQSDSGAAAERLTVVRAAINKLPPKFHIVINLTVFEEVTPEDAAKLLDCKTSTVYWRIHKARKLLKRQLASEVDDE